MGKTSKTLDFLFTPRVEAVGTGEGNPHAKASSNNAELVDALKAKFGDDVLDVKMYANEHTIFVSKDKIVDVCQWMHDDQDYKYMSDLGGVDRFTEDDRFEVFYQLVSMSKRKRVRLKIRVDEDDLNVPTVCGVYTAANWNERQVWDMFGIKFDGHPDLRRVFLPEDFEYHPLRKEFPNLGIPGSLPIPSQTDDGKVQMDPFPASRGQKPERRTPFSE